MIKKLLCKLFGHPNGQRPYEIHWKYKRGLAYMTEILCCRCRESLVDKPKALK